MSQRFGRIEHRLETWETMVSGIITFLLGCSKHRVWYWKITIHTRMISRLVIMGLFSHIHSLNAKITSIAHSLLWWRVFRPKKIYRNWHRCFRSFERWSQRCPKSPAIHTIRTCSSSCRQWIGPITNGQRGYWNLHHPKKGTGCSNNLTRRALKVQMHCQTSAILLH